MTVQGISVQGKLEHSVVDHKGDGKGKRMMLDLTREGMSPMVGKRLVRRRMNHGAVSTRGRLNERKMLEAKPLIHPYGWQLLSD